jgi:hypothetical protein
MTSKPIELSSATTLRVVQVPARGGVIANLELRHGRFVGPVADVEDVGAADHGHAHRCSRNEGNVLRIPQTV